MHDRLPSYDLLGKVENLRGVFLWLRRRAKKANENIWDHITYTSIFG